MCGFSGTPEPIRRAFTHLNFPVRATCRSNRERVFHGYSYHRAAMQIPDISEQTPLYFWCAYTRSTAAVGYSSIFALLKAIHSLPQYDREPQPCVRGSIMCSLRVDGINPEATR